MSESTYTFQEDLDLFMEMITIHRHCCSEEEYNRGAAMAQEVLDRWFESEPKVKRGEMLIAISVMAGTIAADWRKQESEYTEKAKAIVNDIQQRETTNGLHRRSRQHRRGDV